MKLKLFAVSVAAMMIASSAHANEYAEQLNALASGKIKEIAQSAEVVEAVKAQNAMTSAYDQAKVDALDKQWRAEVDASDKPLISKTLAAPVSAYLLGVQESSEGLFTEIFAMDGIGLNVGQSGVTSDYWQGDETKWSASFNEGAGQVFIGELELDESTQTYAVQISAPVIDRGETIGVLVVGVTFSYVESKDQ